MNDNLRVRPDDPERLKEGAPPFTPEELAQRWVCTPQTVRSMAKKELACIRVGRLIRIPAWSVKQKESGQPASSHIAGPSMPSGQKTDSPKDAPSAPKIVQLPNAI